MSKITAAYFHPIHEELPRGLMLHQDGTLTTETGVPYHEYLKDRIAVHNPHVSFPVAVSVLFREDAERLRNNTAELVQRRAEDELERRILDVRQEIWRDEKRQIDEREALEILAERHLTPPGP
jgi:hypothetical protein